MGKATNPRPTAKAQKRGKPSAPRSLTSCTANDDDALARDAQIRAEREADRADYDRLSRQTDVVVHKDKQTRKVTGAQRMDVFALLLSKRALSREAHDAFRAHEETVHAAAGLGTPERRPDYIRASTVGAPGQNVSSAMVWASRLERMTLDNLSPPEAKLLDALMALGASGAAHWRQVVQSITQETRDESQATRVRSLGDNLIHARSKAFTAWLSLQKANDDTPKQPRAKPEPPPSWFRNGEFG